MEKKLLGNLSFVGRTFEGAFTDNPYVLDMDANLYIGPAGHIVHDEHSAIEVIYHFLRQTSRLKTSVRDALKNRLLLLNAFEAFDSSRMDDGSDEFQIELFGTYDGEPLAAIVDDDLPAGPCGKSVNDIKLRFYDICARADPEFHQRRLSAEQQETEARFLTTPFRPRA